MRPLAGMARGVRSSILAWGVVACASSARAEAPAPTSDQDLKASCATGFEQSQTSRRAGRLRDAHEELVTCARYECPRALREQCGVWLEEVERAMPSLVVQASVDGEDLSDVRVEMDGKPLAATTNGLSFEVDPGLHKFRFVYGTLKPIEKSLVMREGEKLRAVQVAFERPKDESATPAPAPIPAPVPTTAPPPVVLHRPIPPGTYVLGSLAIVGGGAFAFFGVSGDHRRKQLEDECAPYCTSKDVDPVRRYMLIANVSLGVGAAALAGAFVTYLVRPSKPADTARLSTHIAIAPRQLSTSVTMRF